jgi:hypothetical protein
MPHARYKHLQDAWEKKNPTYRIDYYYSHKEKAHANVNRYRRLQVVYKQYRMILFDLNDYETNTLGLRATDLN